MVGMMKKSVTMLVVAGLALTGCGWFGGGRTTTVDPATGVSNTLIPKKRVEFFRRPEAVDGSVLIADITQLDVEQTPSGVIISATGLATRQGAYNTELRPVTPELVEQEGILNLEFRVVYPVEATNIGDAATRTVHQAYSMSRQELDGVRTIRVIGAQNVRETRRR